MSRMRRGAVILLFASVGAGLCLAVVGIGWLREESRVRRVVSDTRDNNPGREANEAALTEAVEEGFPPTLDNQRTAVDGHGDSPASVSRESKERDAEWASYPRTKFDLFSRDAFRLVASDLFRNTTLNEGDFYIEPSTRAGFAAWLTESAKRVGGLHEAMAHVSRQELDWMVRRGTAHTVKYSDYLAGLDGDARARIESDLRDKRRELQEGGYSQEVVDATMKGTMIFETDAVLGDAFIHSTKSSSMTIFWAGLREMPQSSDAAKVYYAAAFDFYMQILQFFVQHGGVAPNEVAIISVGVEKRLARFLVN